MNYTAHRFSRYSTRKIPGFSGKEKDEESTAAAAEKSE